MTKKERDTPFAEAMVVNNDGWMRIKSLNPWLFKRDMGGEIPAGPGHGLLPAVTAGGGIAGWVFLTPEVDTVARVLQFGGENPDLTDLIATRLAMAVKLRESVLDPELTSFRLVNSEGDYLPGLVMERYGDVIYVDSQLGFWRRKEEVLKEELLKLLPGAGVLFSWDPGRDPPEKRRIDEYGLGFEILIGKGQKTGHYCDQRENRRLFGKIFRGESVLDLFSYTGGFSLSVGKVARRIVAVDRSAPALDLLRQNARWNGISHIETIQAEADTFLQAHGNQAFDAVVCDPPKLIKRHAEKQSGLRMYFRLNMMALSCVKPGGILLTFSCSGAVSSDELIGLVGAGARKIGRSVQVVAPLSAGPDHPGLLGLPETAYLKGFLLKVF